ncbi:hypothetical protein ON010_g7139 [Phytophthora cinnamomi]|nr:hypothetical protein ON010_g7139 [Phytophthora cinnamomi]
MEPQKRKKLFNSWENIITTLRYGLAFVIVLVAAHPLGLSFPKLFKLPLITGYLVIGIIAELFVANLLTDGLVNMLSNDVSALALSFISFQAGQEIYLPELRPQLNSVMVLLAALYVTAMLILTSAILLAESAFFYDDMRFYCQLGIALMFGSISVLGSPATVMTIKIELNSVGPFTSLMLGVTMTADALAQAAAEGHTDVVRYLAEDGDAVGDHAVEELERPRQVEQHRGGHHLCALHVEVVEEERVNGAGQCAVDHTDSRVLHDDTDVLAAPDVDGTTRAQGTTLNVGGLHGVKALWGQPSGHG